MQIYKFCNQRPRTVSIAMMVNTNILFLVVMGHVYIIKNKKSGKPEIMCVGPLFRFLVVTKYYSKLSSSSYPWFYFTPSHFHSLFLFI